MTLTHIFEIVDTSDDEMHMPQGYYASLEDAIKEITDWPDICDDLCADTYLEIEIHRWPLGKLASSTKVWGCTFTWEGDDSEDGGVFNQVVHTN